MTKNEVVSCLSNIRNASRDLDVEALTIAINAVAAMDTIKGNLVQIEVPNVGDSYIDHSLVVINNVFNACK